MRTWSWRKISSARLDNETFLVSARFDKYDWCPINDCCDYLLFHQVFNNLGEIFEISTWWNNHKELALTTILWISAMVRNTAEFMLTIDNKVGLMSYSGFSTRMQAVRSSMPRTSAKIAGYCLPIRSTYPYRRKISASFSDWCISNIYSRLDCNFFRFNEIMNSSTSALPIKQEQPPTAQPKQRKKWGQGGLHKPCGISGRSIQQGSICDPRRIRAPSY